MKEKKKKNRNTEVQINEKEIGKLPEKKIRIMIAKIIKHLENRIDKCKNQLRKT